MNDLDNLLRAILSDPRENAPRLIYADALSERGGVDGERAEFIRLSIQLDEMDRDAPERIPTAHRIRELFLANAPTGRWPEYGWVYDQARGVLPGPDPAHPVQVDGVLRSVPGCRVRVRRGFPYWLDYPCSGFAQDASRWFRQFPISVVTLLDRFAPYVTLETQADWRNGHFQYFMYHDGHWRRGFREEDDRSLPDEIYDLLTDGDESDGVRTYWAGMVEAQEDLQLACLRYGRRAAGLPDHPLYCHRYA